MVDSLDDVAAAPGRGLLVKMYKDLNDGQGFVEVPARVVFAERDIEQYVRERGLVPPFKVWPMFDNSVLVIGDINPCFL